MTADQRDDGLYECPECHTLYDAEISLIFCCNPQYERGYN